MRPGPLEIILIIAVIIAVVIVARTIRSGRTAARETAAKTSGRKTKGPRSIIGRTGIAFIVIGVIVFFAGISVLRWAFQAYIWSFILVVAGFVMFILTRKKG